MNLKPDNVPDSSTSGLSTFRGNLRDPYSIYDTSIVQSLLVVNAKSDGKPDGRFHE